MSENIHKDHRRRMKEQFLKNGPEMFNDHQLIEMLLFFGIPQGDTNPVAHRLINRFGSVQGVLQTPPRQLMEIKGVGEHTAILLSLCSYLVRKCGEENYPIGIQMCTPDDFGNFFLPRLWGAPNEKMLLMSLNNRHEVLNCSLISEGTVNATEMKTRLILQQALADNATEVVLAHNHPAGNAIPSTPDVHQTLQIANVLASAGITLLDHIVIANNDFVSMQETPTIAHFFKKNVLE